MMNSILLGLNYFALKAQRSRVTMMTNQECSHKECVYILVADDDQAILDLMVYFAKERGWCVDTATSVREIIEKVNCKCNDGGSCYSAIVTDLHYFSKHDKLDFPRLTGVSAARSIREIYKDLPIIFVTGYSNPVSDQEVLKYSNEIMQKPVDFDILFERIDYYIHWYGEKYKGKERRTRSFNLSQNHRRSTDKFVKLDVAVTNAINEVRKTYRDERTK